LGISPATAEEAESQELLAIGDRVRFRHPLARSAVYRSAAAQERRAVHLALAEATEPGVDPDRRAWHLAAAAPGTDEQVAAELERSAGRAKGRGGLAAAAAFLQRAVALTEDPARRTERALVAAQASMQAGAFDGGLGLLATAEAGPIDAVQRARLDLLRAEIAFASRRGSAAPALLLAAAQRLEPLDARLARAGYLQALSAALFAARFASPGAGAHDVASAVQASAPVAGPSTVADLLVDGWAALFSDGCAAATPRLQEALARFEQEMAAAEHLHILWLGTITAPVVWDDARWDALSEFHVDLARSSGALSELPLALNSRIYLHLFRGELDTAEALVDEAEVVIEATEASLTPWGAVALAALRGREHDAATMLEAAAVDATQRGEGIGLTVIAWARAVLYNSLGLPDQALAAAREAIECPTNGAASAWALVELVEAAARVGASEAAEDAAGRFAEIAKAANSDWALGVHARSCALLSTDETAEQHYREALDRLGGCEMGVDLARAHLLYGEWLRREHRRADARVQLRTAHDRFASMGMEGFAERARKELQATGENVVSQIPGQRAELSAHERQIARLARDGLSNPEIGGRLFLSPRTVEWHLHKVFAKLGIRSRSELSSALPSSEPELTAA
jgi:DNA-binding CsgD family transcriptional regulator/tetratricopeptide (TPR) repeat protein